MTLLEVIKNASVNSKLLDSSSEYPIVLKSDDIITNLKPEQEDISASTLIKPFTGWQISPTDAEIIDIGKKFFAQIKTKLKDGNNGMEKGEFIADLNSYLENIRDKVGVTVVVDPSHGGYTGILVEKLGFLIGKDVAGLVLDVCISLEIWDLVEAFIDSGIIEHSRYSNLVTRLVEKKRSDLLCSCLKHDFDFRSPEILSILRYFLSPSKDAHSSMITVKKEWEKEALLAIERASDSNSKRKSLLAKEASILLMVAYDGFSAPEICLHHLVSSSNINDVMLSSSFSKLNGKELINLIRYLSKWLKKYERFPQAVPCPEASEVLGSKACDWVPKLEDVVKCLGLVLDENFSSLVLHPEFHEELRLIEWLVSSLTSEAKFCCLIGDVAGKLKMEAKGGTK